jgi:hypothetical protein
MNYQLEGNTMLFAINRSRIIDISVNDVLTVPDFPEVTHQWTEQDQDFIENNPDDDIYLQVEKIGENKYKANGILLMQAN